MLPFRCQVNAVVLALVGESGQKKRRRFPLPGSPLPPPNTLRRYSLSRRIIASHASEQTLRGVRGNKIAMIFVKLMVSLYRCVTMLENAGEVLSPIECVGRRKSEMIGCLTGRYPPSECRAARAITLISFPAANASVTR